MIPDFGSFQQVSMGLGPIMAIYQARFLKYLINRGLVKDEGRKIWVFLEMEKWMNQSLWGQSV